MQTRPTRVEESAMRLFVALPVPEPVAEALSVPYFGIPGARWMAPGPFHLTLRFLGEVAPAQALDVADALASIHLPPFPLALKGVGHFPPRGSPKVLWAGVAPSEPLLRLQQRIERAMTHAGCEPDPRRFHPHITLARLSPGTRTDRVAAFLAMYALFATEPFEVQEFGLYSSVLREEGALHVLEQAYPLEP